MLTCLACGFEGVAVAVRFVELEPDQRREVAVPVPVVQREGAITVDVVVPERYANELRCLDRAGCADRVARLAMAVEQGVGGVDSSSPSSDEDRHGPHVRTESGPKFSGDAPDDDLGGWV